jgi:hypothetical protein
MDKIDKKTIEQIIEICSSNDIDFGVFIILYGIFNNIKVSHVIDIDYLNVQLNKLGLSIIKSDSGINLAFDGNESTKQLIDRIKAIKTESDNFIVTKEKFNEFFELYPIKVTNGSKVRVLRPATTDAQMYETLYQKYRSKIKTLDAHTKAIKGLKVCLEKVDHNYLQELKTFINQCTWELYSDLEVTNSSYSLYKDE